jgi:hypothetical protein
MPPDRPNRFRHPLRRALVAWAVRLLTKPGKHYHLTAPNDLDSLKRVIRKGDVLLVEGNQRISECIKYLTQSSWSHSALYVGDEPLKRDRARAAELLERYGEEARHLLLEALVESGVVLSPLSKYRDFNIRVCRPHGLSAADARAVLDDALARVGHAYDVKNVIDLARYFLPVTLIPAKWRRKALHFGTGEPTRVICSSLIAECFGHVKFPIVPELAPGELPAAAARAGSLARWLGRPGNRGAALRARALPPPLITPRDFDLSPFFEVVKCGVGQQPGFDYHTIRWVTEEPAA